MKVLKCPECEGITTFTQRWIETIQNEAPVIVEKDATIAVDYHNGELTILDSCCIGNDEGECDNCGSVVPLKDIALIDAEPVVA